MKRLKSKTILLVEDERIIRENLASMLKHFFKDVYIAIDGEDGFDKYKLYHPDTIMTDLKMPNMSGFELIEELLKRDCKAYIVVVSAHTDTHLLIDAINKGVNRYLIKPIVEEDLFKTFESYLEFLQKNEPRIIKIDDEIIFDIDKKVLFIKELEIHLNKKEFLLLKLLCSNENKIFTYEEIDNFVWDMKSMSIPAIRSVVRDLRKKLGDEFIINISSTGYKFK